MKPVLLFLIPSIFLLSCSNSIQYLTVSGREALKDDLHNLVFENDSVRLEYRFNGWNALVISVYNKLPVPLEVNWKKSAFILDDQPVAYYSSDVYLKGDVRMDSSRSLWSRSASYKGDFDARLYRDFAVQFLPPQSVVSKTVEILPRHKLRISFNDQPDQYIRSQSKNGFDFTYRKKTFGEATSPMHFRSYLTLVNAAGTEVYLDHFFYISEVWQSRQYPHFLPLSVQNRGDLMFRRVF